MAVRVLRNVGIVSFVLLASAGLMVDVGYILFRVFNHETTSAINYISLQAPLDVNEANAYAYKDRWFIEANYYSNKRKNGIELQEIKFQHFTDPTLSTQSCNSITMQYVGHYKEKAWNISNDYNTIQNYVIPDFYYYNTYLDVSGDWVGTNTRLNRAEYLIISIDNEPYRIRLDGKYVSGTDWTPGWWPWQFFNTSPHYCYYCYDSLFVDIMHGVATNSAGEGTFYTRIDLSKYFNHIDKYNFTESKWVPVETDLIKNYCVIKFHYSENGATRVSQSLAHVIADNPKYNKNYTDYWQERIKYTLTAKDFAYRYSKPLNGYLLSMSTTMRNAFQKMSRVEVSVDIDLTDTYLTARGINVIGLDYNAFDNFRLKNFTVRGVGDFTCFDQSLYNTYLETLTYSAGLNVYLAQGAINTEYREVRI